MKTGAGGFQGLFASGWREGNNDRLFPEALHYSNAIDLEAPITERIALGDWKVEFDRSFAGDGGKFVIDPSGEN